MSKSAREQAMQIITVNRESILGREISNVLRDEIAAALESKDREIERLRSDVSRSAQLLRDLLNSSDCEWYHRREGHDWKESVDEAESFLKGKSALREVPPTGDDHSTGETSRQGPEGSTPSLPAKYPKAHGASEQGKNQIIWTVFEEEPFCSRRIASFSDANDARDYMRFIGAGAQLEGGIS